MITESHHLRSSAIAPPLICVKTAPYVCAGKENIAFGITFHFKEKKKCVYVGSTIKDNFHLNQINNVNKHCGKGQDGAS